ncbi:MAG TPA: methylated-DNA--[protein]-cysteine S-methyltransferase [Candidatus Acidoferrum sp.]|nr:methylated-DNA--[protein]-cysteine S-methyltransferase [Candidatus Acidoferrum sp.]
MNEASKPARVAEESDEMHYTIVTSPVGPLLLAGDAAGLHFVNFQTGRTPRSPERNWIEGRAAFKEVIRQLRAYFAGKLQKFDLPLILDGTEFQLRVWRELQKIPYGETMSYCQIARRIGNPEGARAVGLANGSNPIPIIIPCHRVIGNSGELRGFGGGLPVKKSLLALESRQLSFL